MAKKRFRTALVLAALGFAASTGTAHAQHATDIWVGRTSSGQVTVDCARAFEPHTTMILLNEINPPGLLAGWSHNDPGFDRVVVDHPENDVFALEPGAQIILEVVSGAPAFRALDAAFHILQKAGDSTALGGHDLHTHVTWQIDSRSDAFKETQRVWPTTFVLRDLGSTGYADSEPFTLYFTNDPTADLRPGDFDFDGDVDLADYLVLANCHGSLSLTCSECGRADLDGDGDIDLADFVIFQTLFTRSQ